MLSLYSCLLVAQIDVGVFAQDYLINVRFIGMGIFLTFIDDEIAKYISAFCCDTL